MVPDTGEYLVYVVTHRDSLSEVTGREVQGPGLFGHDCWEALMLQPIFCSVQLSLCGLKPHVF